MSPLLVDLAGTSVEFSDAAGSLEPMARLCVKEVRGWLMGYAEAFLDEAQVRTLIARMEAWLSERCAPAPVEVPEFSINPIEISAIGHSILRGMAEEAIEQTMDWQAFSVTIEGQGQPTFLLWLPAWKRAGVAWCDVSSSPRPVWTTAASPEEAVKMFLRGELLP